MPDYQDSFQHLGDDDHALLLANDDALSIIKGGIGEGTDRVIGLHTQIMRMKQHLLHCAECAHQYARLSLRPDGESFDK